MACFSILITMKPVYSRLPVWFHYCSYFWTNQYRSFTTDACTDLVSIPNTRKANSTIYVILPTTIILS